MTTVMNKLVMIMEKALLITREDDEDEEEHLAPANSSAIPIVDPVPSTEDIEAFETDESAPIPRPPQIRIPFTQTRLCRARKTVRPEPPMSAAMEARIAEHAAAPTPHHTINLTDVPEAEMPPQKRACLTTLAPGYEIGESSAAVHCETAQGLLLGCRGLRSFRDRPYHRHTALALDREAVYARIAWTSSEERSTAIEAHKMLPTRRTTRTTPATTTTPTTTVTNAQLQALIDQGVAATLAERDASRSRDGDNSHGSGTTEKTMPTQTRMPYTDFFEVPAYEFQMALKGVVGLTAMAT
ncbi:hypothetical protein Tco_0581220 [Tanacetum coccineum]